MEIIGDFEVHITLDAPDLAPVLCYAHKHGLKVTHIVLGHGKHPSQPMLTGRTNGKLSDVLVAYRGISEELSVLGVPTLRIKVETSIENAIAPENDIQAASLPENWHFEHHVKILCEDNRDLGLVSSVADQHTARLSKNALRQISHHRDERFLTQRFYRRGKCHSKKALKSLLDDLAAHKVTVIETEAEYVIYDSNVTLDIDWIATH